MENVIKTTMKDIVNTMVKNATTLDHFAPEPTKNRFNTKTFIYCVDSIPKNYIVEEINKLYWINDRHGFFIVNKDNIVNLSESIEDWDTGIDKYIETSPINMGTVGTRLLLNVNGDIVVYKIIGFENSNGSVDVYGDIR